MASRQAGLLCAVGGMVLAAASPLAFAQGAFRHLPVIKKGTRAGFANAGWKYDRYADLQSLDAGTRMTVADLKGPGVITHIHTTRHKPSHLFARGIVLEIYFDDAPEPAVRCPLADFFGDGCNGRSMYFTSNLIECAPWSYNCYFPMPFKKRAKVILRNDTDRDAMNYSYVEWEPLPAWKPDLGYFHATYQRKSFQLTRNTDEVLFHVKGTGHLIGRQYSVTTNEPLFKRFAYLMEGNNEVDIDGKERALDYLGTEDSFTFSWGFQQRFAGLRAGVTLVDTKSEHRLSVYRFHDHMPIRFDKELRWHINWKYERIFTQRPEWARTVERGGCWVNYATVHYWYQETPGGYTHAPLRPVEERREGVLGEGVGAHSLDGILKKVEVDSQLRNTFSTRDDMKRVHIMGTGPKHPFWIDEPKPEGGDPGNPNPGRQGILAVHPRNQHTECLILTKVALPADKASRLRLVVSGDPYEAPGKSDFRLQVGVHDGKKMTWLRAEAIDAGTPPSVQNWKTLEYSLRDFAGKTVGIAVKLSCGGPKHRYLNEEAFFDEISILVGE